MNEVTDAFLMTVAQTAATLLGLLLLGGFFYLETGLSRARAVGRAGEAFLRATVTLTLLLYTLILVVSLALVALRPWWVSALFILIAVGLIRAQVQWTISYRQLCRLLPLPRGTLWLGWGVTVVVLALPWALGGLPPSREAFTWSLLLAGALALQSTAGLLLTSFDLARLEEEAARRAGGEGGD